MELEGYSRLTCNKRVLREIHKLDRRRVSFSTPIYYRLAVAKFSKSTVSGKSCRWKYAYFLRYPNFLITQIRIDKTKLPRQNLLYLSSRLDTIPACDGRTDRQTHDDSIYRASIASRSKINRVGATDWWPGFWALQMTTLYARCLRNCDWATRGKVPK